MTSPRELLGTEPLPDGAEIRFEPVRYRFGETEFEGLFVWNATVTGPRPGIAIVHDWMGRGEHAAVRAELLARLGYAALALDMYGVGVVPTPQTAPKLSGALYADLAELRGRAAAGLDALAARPEVDPARLAIMGYCFGGTVSIELARSGAPLLGAVSFHGGLIVHEPADVELIRAKLLLLNGAADPVVPRDKVEAFQRELASRPEVDWQFVDYSGALHAFAVPDANAPERGVCYDARADRRSWRAMRNFFEELFGA